MLERRHVIPQRYLDRARNLLFPGEWVGNANTRYILPGKSNYHAHTFLSALRSPDAQKSEHLAYQQLKSANDLDADADSKIHLPSQISTSNGNITIETKNAKVIGRRTLLELLDPITPNKKRENTVLISTLDQVLSSYFFTDVFSGIDFQGVSYKTDGLFRTINKRAATLKSWDNLTLLAKKRKVKVRILPFPNTEDFPVPQYSLIVPEEADLAGMLQESQNSKKTIKVLVDNMHVPLAVSYLKQFNPARIVVSSFGRGFEVLEREKARFTFDKPSPVKGLDFSIDDPLSYAIDYVRSDYEARHINNDAGVLGFDVVPANYRNDYYKLKVEEVILPACFPVRIQLI